MSKFSPRQLLRQSARLSYHDMILEEAGLVSYWNFGAGVGNKLWDQKGVNHGTINGATWTQKSNGNYMLDFDGDNDFVDCGNATIYTFDYDDSFTLEAWLYINLLDQQHTLVNKKDLGGNGKGYTLTVQAATNLVTLAMSQGAGNIAAARSKSAFSAGQWYHLVGVYDGTGGNHKIYINGVDDTDTTASFTSDTTSTHVLEIGLSANNVDFMEGSINEVAIYNVALSPATILKHYQVGA